MTQITLRALNGSDRGRVYQNLPTPVTIGREEGNVVQLNDDRVSRFHIKIQEDRDKIVLTDLDSTNGTRVNGEDVTLRILRPGDVITVGRTMLVFGSRDQIAQRLAALRQAQLPGADESQSVELFTSLDYELNWGDEEPDALKTLQSLEPPELPNRLSPAQAAELAELLEYFHVRIRDLIAGVKAKSDADRVVLDMRQWQNTIDLQTRLSEYLRSINNPGESG